jgi:hypothetical protein
MDDRQLLTMSQFHRLRPRAAGVAVLHDLPRLEKSVQKEKAFQRSQEAKVHAAVCHDAIEAKSLLLSTLV